MKNNNNNYNEKRKKKKFSAEIFFVLNRFGLLPMSYCEKKFLYCKAKIVLQLKGFEW